MKIILATGIFPPDIGGPATYVRGVAKELAARGDSVTVVTYASEQGTETMEGYTVVRIARRGGIVGRWLQYRAALREYGTDADGICAFSSVSAGIPLFFSGIQKAERVLRLGGDFFWERYTDGGGRLSLREWYRVRFGFWRLLNMLVMGRILRSFDRIVYSTEFQKRIHQDIYRSLPPCTVLDNARPAGAAVHHEPHEPFRLLFMGRFVRFKNVGSLLQAVQALPNTVLTVVGDGPLRYELERRVNRLMIRDRVRFHPPVTEEEKQRIFAEHDLLVLPSFTEISPNVALEARSFCLPVLLTDETGIQELQGITKRKMTTPEEIAAAILDCIARYESPSYDDTIQSYGSIAEALFPARNP